MDFINGIIDNILIFFHLADPSIRTNGQALELMKTGLISRDNIDSLIQRIATDYNPAILDAKVEVAEYLEALPKGNRSVSDEKRQKIEKAMVNSDKNKKGMNFTKIIDSIYRESRGEIQKRKTKQYIAEKKEEEKKSQLSDQIDNLCTLCLVSYEEGHIPESMIILTHTLQQLVNQGKEKIIIKKDQDEVSIQDIVNDIQTYISHCLDNQYTDEENKLPERVKKVQTYLETTTEYKERRTKYFEEKVAGELQQKGLDIEVIRDMIANSNVPQQLNPIKYLAFMGNLLEDRLDENAKQIIISSDSGDVYRLYFDDVDYAIKILKKINNDAMSEIKDIRPQRRHTSVDEEGIKLLAENYRKSKERVEFNRLPVERRLEILREPIQDSDSEFITKEKEAYIQRQHNGSTRPESHGE